MGRFIRILALGLSLALLPSLAWAQCSGVFAANQVCGSIAGGTPGPVNSVLFPAGLVVGTSTIIGGSSTGVLFNNSGVLGSDPGLTYIPNGLLSVLGPSSTLLSTANTPNVLLIQSGSLAAPITVGNTPTVTISRIENITNGVSTGDGSLGSAVRIDAFTFGTQQLNGFKVSVQANPPSVGNTNDIVAVYAAGLIHGTCPATELFCHAYGVYSSVGADVAHGGAVAFGSNLLNNTGASHSYSTTAVPNLFTGLDLVYDGSVNSWNAGVGILVRNSAASGGTGKWDVGFAAQPSSIVTAFLQDDSSSATVLLVHGGAHSVGIDLSGGTFSGNQFTGVSGFSISSLGAVVTTGQNITHSLASTNSNPVIIRTTGGANTLARLDNGTASKQVFWEFDDAATPKWYAGKQTDNSFVIYDAVLNQPVLRALSNASAEVDFGITSGVTGLACIVGVTSGKVCQTVPAAAGTPTVTWGSSSGTPAVTASAPLAITAATGNITCATCATTTNGGALSATSPVQISAAGVISLVGTTGTGTTVVLSTGPTISGTATSITNVGTFALRDASAAFDLTIVANSSSAALTAGRTLTIDTGNVAHTIKLGTTANTITFPNTGSDTVAMLAVANTFTADVIVSVNDSTQLTVFNSNGTGQYAAINYQTSHNGYTAQTYLDSNTPKFVFNAPSGVPLVFTVNNNTGIQINTTTGVTIGSATLTTAAGELGFTKITASGSAPGAGGAKIDLVCGTGAGTAKLIIYAGTSATPVNIVDNVGAGVSGC